VPGNKVRSNPLYERTSVNAEATL